MWPCGNWASGDQQQLGLYDILVILVVRSKLSFISDLGVFWLLLATIKVWQANLLTAIMKNLRSPTVLDTFLWTSYEAYVESTRLKKNDQSAYLTKNQKLYQKNKPHISPSFNEISFCNSWELSISLKTNKKIFNNWKRRQLSFIFITYIT